MKVSRQQRKSAGRWGIRYGVPGIPEKKGEGKEMRKPKAQPSMTDQLMALKARFEKR